MTRKFICDGMLGKLCRLMRLCGFDTAYTNEGMAIIVKARREHRVILTKNTRLEKKEGVLFIQPDRPFQQLEEVVKAFHLRSHLDPFSRCLSCNHPLERVSKETVKHRVPFYTYQHFDVFAQCNGCSKVYWQGSHYAHMARALADHFGDTGHHE